MDRVSVKAYKRIMIVNLKFFDLILRTISTSMHKYSFRFLVTPHLSAKRSRSIFLGKERKTSGTTLLVHHHHRSGLGLAALHFVDLFDVQETYGIRNNRLTKLTSAVKIRNFYVLSFTTIIVRFLIKVHRYRVRNVFRKHFTTRRRYNTLCRFAHFRTSDVLSFS
jgi:hypothetical protein